MIFFPTFFTYYWFFFLFLSLLFSSCLSLTLLNSPSKCLPKLHHQKRKHESKTARTWVLRRWRVWSWVKEGSCLQKKKRKKKNLGLPNLDITYLSVCLSVHVSVIWEYGLCQGELSLCLVVCLSACLSACLPIHPFICMSISDMLVCLLPIFLPIHSSTVPSLSVCLSVCCCVRENVLFYEL